MSVLLTEARRTLALAGPIIIGQVSQILLGVTDNLMIGQVGKVPLAAATFANSIFGFIYIIGIGLLVPVAVLVSRAESGRRPTVSRVAVSVGVPVYAAVVAVALFPRLTDLTDLTPLQVEAFLICAILLLGLNASWFFSHEAPDSARAGGTTASAGADAPRA